MAEVFGKNHYHVMRDIRSLVEKGVSNFGLSSYINAQNKEQPMYLMDRDGFSLLVMGLKREGQTMPPLQRTYSNSASILNN